MAEENDGDDLIDDEQLEEFEEMLDQLGAFADKVTINSLSMVAEDFKDSRMSASKLYGTIRDRLLSSSVGPERKLPLVYAVDSILKNARGGPYGLLVERDGADWMGRVHSVLGDEGRNKLKRVWNTWKEFGVFGEETWKRIGRCFVEAEEQATKARKEAEEKAKAHGVECAVSLTT